MHPSRGTEKEERQDQGAGHVPGVSNGLYIKKKKKKTLFPPQGDVFVTIDKLTSTGIKVVSETLKKPGHGNKAVHYFVLSSLFGRKDSFTVCN